MSVTPLLYGKGFAEALYTRLRSHFAELDQPDKPQPAPLTIGLFGGWGSGKTLHLEQLQQRFAQTPFVAGQPVTLPVLFNAWRHESEPHLIVPLLKTTQHTLNRWLQSQQSVGDKVRSALTNTVGSFKDSALALAAGLSGKLALPGIGEIGVDFDKMLAEDDKRQTARQNANFGLPKSIADLDAIYHDFENHLRALTGVGDNDKPRLNLLFLIDDLDRCLPEKAVQMLESIKLFLDVPGCAFVLALDDEVVERGIAHRYRDYRHAEPAWDSVAHALSPARFAQFQAERDHQQVGPDNPVSGHEYLEKMVHLPVHVPRPVEAEVRSYLAQRFPVLFEQLPARMERDPSAPQGGEHDRNAAENAIRARLIELIVRAAPNNPRKLNRLAELYAFKLDVAAGNGWQLKSETERLTLLRLAAIQLLAPALYRFGAAGQWVFVSKLEQWLVEGGENARTSGYLEQRNRDLRTQYANEAHYLRPHERLDEPLLAHLRNAQHQRSGFDPFDLLDPSSRCDSGLKNYYFLSRQIVTGELHATETGSDRAHIVGSTGTITTAPAAKLSHRHQFVEQLLAADPLVWRNALEQESEALAGRVLDDTTFAQLEAGIQINPSQVSLPWLEPLTPHLTTDQLQRLYKASSLLRRLNDALPPEARP